MLLYLYTRYPSQPYDVSKLKRHKFSQDAAFYSKMSNISTSKHAAAESECSETMDLFTQYSSSQDIEWLHQSNKTDPQTPDSQILHTMKTNKNNNNTKNNEHTILKLKQSQSYNVSLKTGRSQTAHQGTSKSRPSPKKIKKYHTFGHVDDIESDSELFWTEGRNALFSQTSRLSGLKSIDEDFDMNFDLDEFSFDVFAMHNQLLDIRPRERDKKFDEKVLGSDYLSFELDKELDALECMINRVRQENELLHEIQQLELNDMDMIEFKLSQLSEMSLSYSNQSLVLDVATDILKEITEIPQVTNKNESRAQCVEYQASIIDVGKTSCIRDAELWQNTVWCNDDFMSQGVFDINVMKHNRINDNKPRCLYTDLKHKTLTIHDPTTKGKKKDNKVLDETLIKSFNYTQNRADSQAPDRDIISITYWPEKTGKNKRHFQGLVQKYVGHRFVTLMKIYITPSRIPPTFKFGQGLFMHFRI